MRQKEVLLKRHRVAEALQEEKKMSGLHQSRSDSSTILNPLVTFPRLQSESDCRVNFKYHEIIAVFCKNGRLGLEPAISWTADERVYHQATKPSPLKCQKLCNFIVIAEITPNSAKFREIKGKVFLHIVHVIQYAYVAIWGAVSPNNSWCPYLVHTIF